MDFKLSKTHLLQQELYRKFAENEIKPIAEDMDESEEYDLDLLAKMHKYGFFGIPYSKEYGGVGGDYLSYVLCMEEVSRVDGSTGITISVHTSLCCSCIDGFGTEEQKQKFLRPLIDGSKTGCFGLTEPNAGSDAAGQQTQAVYDEATDEYIINGGKIFTTNSGFADTCIVFAMTDKTQGTRGISAFVVPLKDEEGNRTPGVTVSDNIRRMGIRAASNCEVSYENVRVPAGNRLGKRRTGLQDRDESAGRRKNRDRSTVSGTCTGSTERSDGICKREKAVRKTDLSIPDNAVQTGRYADKDRCSKTSDIQSSGNEGRGRQLRTGGSDGEAVCIRHGKRGMQRSGTADGRIRILQRIPCRESIERRQDNRDIRRNIRSNEDGYFGCYES